MKIIFEVPGSILVSGCHSNSLLHKMTPRWYVNRTYRSAQCGTISSALTSIGEWLVRAFPFNPLSCSLVRDRSASRGSTLRRPLFFLITVVVHHPRPCFQSRRVCPKNVIWRWLRRTWAATYRSSSPGASSGSWRKRTWAASSSWAVASWKTSRKSGRPARLNTICRTPWSLVSPLNIVFFGATTFGAVFNKGGPSNVKSRGVCIHAFHSAIVWIPFLFFFFVTFHLLFCNSLQYYSCFLSQ